MGKLSVRLRLLNCSFWIHVSLVIWFSFLLLEKCYIEIVRKMFSCAESFMRIFQFKYIRIFHIQIFSIYNSRFIQYHFIGFLQCKRRSLIFLNITIFLNMIRICNIHLMLTLQTTNSSFL